MNCWDILGVKPTNDLTEIKKAYATQSKWHHPEDDPEGFIRLRNAYTEAAWLAKYEVEVYADWDEAPPFEFEDVIGMTASKTEHIMPMTDMPKQNEENEIVGEIDGTLNFDNILHHEVPEEDYYENNFFNRNKKQLKHQATKLKWRNFTRTFAFRVIIYGLIFVLFMGFMTSTLSNNRNQSVPDTKSLINAHGIKSSGHINMLMARAFELWTKQNDSRVATLKDIQKGTSFLQSPSASNLNISEDEYNILCANYKNFGVQVVTKSLETYGNDDSAFVSAEILPIIKQGILSDSLYLTVMQLGSMVGFSNEELLDLHAQKFGDYNIQMLDHILLTHKRLVPPSQWRCHNKTINELLYYLHL